MEKKFDRAHEETYSGDSVIKRGYEIYDGWKAKKFTSRKIVDSAERTAASARKNGTKRAYIEALSCLFALDMRIKEKYNHFLLRLFLYFFWRNEMRALKLLKDVCHISDKHVDVRTAIEVALHKLREKMETEEAEGSDKDVRGGKRNKKADEEAVSAEEKQQDQVKEEAQKDTLEESADKEESKEAAEEKAEELDDQTPTDEKEALAEKKENPQKDAENTVHEEKEQGKQEERNENKTENNGPEESAEPSTDKAKEAKTYNDALDPPLPYDFSEKAPRSKPAEKTSSDDAFLWDQMFLKEKEEGAAQNSTQDVQQGDVQQGKGNDLTKSEEAATGQNTEERLLEAAREQMEIADAEVGVEKPVEIVGKTNVTETKATNAVHERK